MKTLTRQLLALLVATSFLFAAHGALAAAGKAVFVTGTVNVERGGTRPLKVGDAIEVGDVIVTGDASRAQLLMGDGARIALRAVTRFRIDAFALPSNMQQVGRGESIAASGQSVSTLLKGGFRTRTGVIGKADPTAYEVRTPIGTLGVRGTDYTAVFCRGDCADAPGIAPGQPIPDGLYLAVDEGTISFNGRGLNLVLPAPRFEFIPLQTGDPQQLFNPPAFLRGDGGGPLVVAGRPAGTPGAAAPRIQLGGFSDRRAPSESDPAPRPAQGTDGESAPAETNNGDPSKAPQQTVRATSPLGTPVDITNPIVPVNPQTTVATSVSRGAEGIGYVGADTLPTDQFGFEVDSLVQFTATDGAVGVPVTRAYDIGTASSTDLGSNVATGIRWGRWTNGNATAARGAAVTTLDLSNASLHWLLSPDFETVPVVPTTGTAGFVLAGGTDPTDSLGNIGTLGGAFLQADFTNATVTSTLALNINGFDWLATGTTAITAGALFDGNYDDVLIDGRVTGNGSFTGFFTAAPGTQNPLNGAGLAYSLIDNPGALGTISGVAALVPGNVVLPTPLVVRRHVGYSFGFIGQTFGDDEQAVNTQAQIAVDANGDLTQFSGAAGAFQIGTAANVNPGSNVPTNLRWGRWTGGNATGPSGPISLANSSLHWIMGGEYGAAPMLPQTGTANYVLVGNTDPTDTRGQVGTLGGASFSADFTNATVATAIGVTIDGRDWYLSGTGTYTQGSNGFTGTYLGSLGALIPANGEFSGFFTLPTLGGASVAGAGVNYRFHDIFAFDELSGVLAFQQGNGQPLPPPPEGVRDIAMTSIAGQANGTIVLATPAPFYAADVNFNLTQLVGVINTDPVEFGVYDILSSTTVESGSDPLTMLRWGRWSGGNITMTGVTTGQTFTESLAQSSVHWIEGANGATPPVLPTTGTATYTLFGFTQPTDTFGNVGALGSATFDADFTTFAVDTTLDLTVNNLNWVMIGRGTIGGQTTPGHQFNGTYNGIINPIQGVASGIFSGFFTAPGGTVPGVPGGAGLTYSLTDGQGLNEVNGAVVFRGP